MKRDITLPVLAAAGGIGGFFLRRWQLVSAYRPETGLFVHGAPATLALLGLTALLALALLLLLLKKREGAEDFLPAFGSPGVKQLTVLVSAGILMGAAGSIGLRDGFRALRLWREMPGQYQLSVAGSQLLTGVLFIIAGFGVVYMGRMAYRGKLDNAACFLVPFPALAGLVWVFSAHLKHGTEPVLMKYGFELFAALLLTLAHYYVAGFLYGKPRPRRALFCALLGTAVGITSLASSLTWLGGAPDPFAALAAMAFSLSALSFAHALLGGPWPDRMPPPEEDEDDSIEAGPNTNY